MDYINLHHNGIFCMAKILGQSKAQKPMGWNNCNIIKKITKHPFKELLKTSKKMTSKIEKCANNSSRKFMEKSLHD